MQSREETARSVKMAEMLLQRGCDASAKDANGMTPLMFAIQMVNSTSDISNMPYLSNEAFVCLADFKCF